jgi:hypothetical protein
MNSKKLLTLLGAAGVAVHAASIGGLPAKAAISDTELEQVIRQDPTGQGASDAFDMLAGRFKDKGDKGRPDGFGDPGKPPEDGDDHDHGHGNDGDKPGNGHGNGHGHYDG